MRPSRHETVAAILARQAREAAAAAKARRGEPLALEELLDLPPSMVAEAADSGALRHLGIGARRARR